MMPWLALIGLRALSMLAYVRLVPRATRVRYSWYPKNLTAWAAQLLFNGIWVVAAIQWALDPVDMPFSLRLSGALLIVIGDVLLILAVRRNPFFIPAVKYIPKELRVIDGVYRLKHPGYIGLALSAIGAFLLLGQDWAIWPLGSYLGLIARRTWIESRVLAH